MMPTQPELNVKIKQQCRIFTLYYNDQEWLIFKKPVGEDAETFKNDLLVMMRGERLIDMDGADFEALFEGESGPHCLECRKIDFSGLKKCEEYENLMMELAGKNWVSVTFTAPSQVTLFDFSAAVSALDQAYPHQDKLIDSNHPFELIEDESIKSAYIWVFYSI